jgi:Regulator of chromosome condensation (RCC1) repeat
VRKLAGFLLGGVLLSSWFGCGGAATEEEEELLGEATLAVTTVPTSVLCIQIVAAGSKTVTKQFSVTGGSSSTSLSLGKLPVGQVTFNATAYDLACASIGSDPGSWVADKVTATLTAGVTTKVALTFRALTNVTASANFVGGVAQIGTSFNGTYAVMTDGTVKSWGSTPPSGSSLTPTNTTLTSVAAIDGGFSHTCLVKKDGTVWCMGTSVYGELGPGVSLGSTSATPVQVTGLSKVTEVVDGRYHSCALTSSGAIYCWGYNFDGELGNGTTTNSSSPVRVNASGTGQHIAAGAFHNCLLDSMGMARCWGYNGFGQLGVEAMPGLLSPGTALGPGYVGIGAGAYHSCALRGDGAVHCWGDNGYGQLGDGTTDPHINPASVVGLTNATQLAVGDTFSCTRTTTGSVSCWGKGYDGEIGNGTGQGQLTPAGVVGITDAQFVAAGASHACALLASQSLRCWGDNTYGQIGDGTVFNRFTPVAVTLP